MAKVSIDVVPDEVVAVVSPVVAGALLLEVEEYEAGELFDVKKGDVTPAPRRWFFVAVFP